MNISEQSPLSAAEHLE